MAEMVSAVKSLSNTLLEIMPANLDARERILNDVHVAHLLAGSRFYIPFIFHACCNLHRLMSYEHANLLEHTDLDKEQEKKEKLEKRTKLIKAFADAICEIRNGIREEGIRTAIRVTIGEGAAFERSENLVICKNARGDFDYSDGCPFGKDGEQRLDTANKDKLFSYLTDTLALCQFTDSNFIASWNTRGFTENYDILKRNIRAILKSFHIQKSESYIQKEIIDSLSVLSNRVKRADWHYIPVKNGIVVLDKEAYNKPFKEGEAFKIIPYSRNIYVTNCLNCEFNPDDQINMEVKEILYLWANKSVALQRVLEELIGFCISAYQGWKGAAIIFGDGNCGKTKMLTAIENMLGSDNVVHEQLNELSKDFFLAPLLCKTLCIGDDVSGGSLPDFDQANIKNLTSQGVVQVNIKGRQPFQGHIRSLLIFAANTLPIFSDFTCRKRIVPIPFLHQFKTNESKKDIDAILQSSSGRNYLFYVGLKGLIRMQSRSGDRFADFFTKCPELDAAIKEFDSDSSLTNEWIKCYMAENGVGENSKDFFLFTWNKNLSGHELSKRSVRNLYKHYCSWCSENKCKAETRKNWKKQVLQYFHMSDQILTTKADCSYTNMESGKTSTAEFFIVPNSEYSPQSRNSIKGAGTGDASTDETASKAQDDGGARNTGNVEDGEDDAVGVASTLKTEEQVAALDLNKRSDVLQQYEDGDRGNASDQDPMDAVVTEYADVEREEEADQCKYDKGYENSYENEDDGADEYARGAGEDVGALNDSSAGVAQLLPEPISSKLYRTNNNGAHGSKAESVRQQPQPPHVGSGTQQVIEHDDAKGLVPNIPGPETSGSSGEFKSVIDSFRRFWGSQK